MGISPVRVFAAAKINLCLHVTGQRPDGYHLLDSLVGFADIGDRLEFTAGDRLGLSLDGPFGAGLAADQDNLVLRAAHLFQTRDGCAIRLEKHLPISSGIGGGSADAAAALHGLAHFWNRPLPDLKAQLSLGADVPVCVYGKPVRMQGIGEQLTPAKLPDLPVVLVNPGVAVATPRIFQQLASKTNPPLAPLSSGTHDLEQMIHWLSRQRNDLQAAAVDEQPVIADVLQEITGTGALLTRMSGSGATCFGLFASRDSARKAAQMLRGRHPDWWVQPTIIRGSNHPRHNKI